MLSPFYTLTNVLLSKWYLPFDKATDDDSVAVDKLIILVGSNVVVSPGSLNTASWN